MQEQILKKQILGDLPSTLDDDAVPLPTASKLPAGNQNQLFLEGLSNLGPVSWVEHTVIDKAAFTIVMSWLIVKVSRDDCSNPETL